MDKKIDRDAVHNVKNTVSRCYTTLVIERKDQFVAYVTATGRSQSEMDLRLAALESCPKLEEALYSVGPIVHALDLAAPAEFVFWPDTVRVSSTGLDRPGTAHRPSWLICIQSPLKSPSEKRPSGVLPSLSVLPRTPSTVVARTAEKVLELYWVVTTPMTRNLFDLLAAIARHLQCAFEKHGLSDTKESLIQCDIDGFRNLTLRPPRFSGYCERPVAIHDLADFGLPFYRAWE